MDEHIAPNCAALMEPGREYLLLLDNAPSHACRLACDHHQTVSNGTVGFQPPCSPDLSPVDFFLWKELKTQLVQCPTPANPAELRTSDPRVHRTWTGSCWMFENVGKAWVRKQKACVAAKSEFFEKHKHGRLHRTAQRHSAKHVINTHLTLHGTFRRHRHRHRLNAKRPACQSNQLTDASQNSLTVTELPRM